MMRSALVVAAVVLATPLYAQQPYKPARYTAGSPPVLPALSLGGGQAFVELTVAPDGTVQKVTPLRSTPPFTQGLIDAVSGWRFAPALEDALGPDGTPQGPKPVASKILVASLFRAPTLVGPTIGEKTVNVASASPEVVYPTATNEPPYPPQAFAPGVVLIEVSVNAAGAATELRVVSSAPPFDQPALEAARKWRFRPSQVKGHATAGYAYLAFGFPQPVGPTFTGPGPGRPGSGQPTTAQPTPKKPGPGR
jgi:periplasmic protein TonB